MFSFILKLKKIKLVVVKTENSFISLMSLHFPFLLLVQGLWDFIDDNYEST